MHAEEDTLSNIHIFTQDGFVFSVFMLASLSCNLSFLLFHFKQPEAVSSYSDMSNSYSILCNPLPHWILHHPA